MIVEKNRCSAFMQGHRTSRRCCARSGLDTLPDHRHRHQRVLQSTARDAMMRNFKTIMVTDGNAASTDEDHNAALNNYLSDLRRRHVDRFSHSLPHRNAQKGLAAAE